MLFPHYLYLKCGHSIILQKLLTSIQAGAILCFAQSGVEDVGAFLPKAM